MTRDGDGRRDCDANAETMPPPPAIDIVIGAPSGLESDAKATLPLAAAARISAAARSFASFWIAVSFACVAAISGWVAAVGLEELVVVDPEPVVPPEGIEPVGGIVDRWLIWAFARLVVIAPS